MNRPFLRQFPYTFVSLALAFTLLVVSVAWDISGFDLPGVDTFGIDRAETDVIVMAVVLVLPAFFVDRAVTRQRMHDLQLVDDQLRVLQMTMRTVQDIVGNALMSLYLFRVEAEPHVSPQALELFDQIIAETGAKLKAIGDLKIVGETRMAGGMGIDYQRSQQDGKPKT